MSEVVLSSHPSSRALSRALSPQQMQVDKDTEMDALLPDTITISGSSKKAYRKAPSSPGFPEEERRNVLDEEDPSPPDDSWKTYQDK
jgi:hypothetical protein